MNTQPSPTPPPCGLLSNGHRVPLLGVEVAAEVVAGHVRTVVRQRYRNDESRPIEAIYTFPVPARGGLTAFAMTVNGRRLEGEVQEREEAFKHYDEAITSGHGAALVEQERPNVFTANVGNLLPGEETIIELEILEPATADEGAIRFCLPTLVAPRYMGAPVVTPSVPDADRISPPIAPSGHAPYGLSLELVFDVGVDVDVESPSHAIRVVDTRPGGRTRVAFVQNEVGLDRDIVVTAFPKTSVAAAAPIASVVAHRDATRAAFGLALVPDLAGALQKRAARSDVVFVLDRSGSMGGSSIDEAKTALRLCLRQLREGDRFAILAFDTEIEEMSPSMIPFSARTLDDADRWIEGIQARGGTEMLEPLERAIRLAPDGILVLLTDGQVGNEDEILRKVLARRGAARVYSFGIGTNVSDTLLLDLADKTGGATIGIHPGERVDDKVVAQFARATAPRVTGLELRFRGVDVGDVAPASPVALVDGEPFAIFGTYEKAGRGVAEIRGTYEGEKFYLEVPFDLPEREERPAVVKLWAQQRIKDLERHELEGRRMHSMKDRIVRLAKEHGVSSKYTSFVVVEKRTGDRRTSEQAATRVVPVNAPAGWAMFDARRYAHDLSSPQTTTRSGSVNAPAARMMVACARRSSSYVPRPAAMAAPAPAPASAPPPARGLAMHLPLSEPDAAAPPPPPADPILAVLARQSANGLWEEPARDAILVTIEALLALLRGGITTAHPIHGAQTKKAVDALLATLASGQGSDPKVAELALGVAWLLSSGRRTRATIRDATTKLAPTSPLASLLGRPDDELRAHVERLA